MDYLFQQQLEQRVMECERCKKEKAFSRCFTCPPRSKPKQAPSSGLLFCQACDLLIHEETPLPENLPLILKSHERIFLCQECEGMDATVYCSDCEQYLCPACAKSIHNKGAR